ncbi:MAG: GTPase [Candidatus Krumholzibacteriia bacterium]
MLENRDAPGIGGTTVVARVTAAGEAGLAVVRVSGPAALAVARAVAPALGAEPETHRARRTLAVWPEQPAILGQPEQHGSPGLSGRPEPPGQPEQPGQPGRPGQQQPPPGLAPGDPLDDVVVLVFRGPHSYTGEDVVEISCHGGPMSAHLVVEACLAAGAAPAGAGEFTRRAFLNGKLSLDQAEAVADLIQAEDVLSARGALQQLRGGLDREIRAVERPLLALQAELEGGLEFLEEERPAVDPRRIVAPLTSALADVERLLALATAGRRLRDGVHVTLVGAPNVGKSSLFNALLGEARAIVDDEAGTTRDVVTAHRDRDGVRYHLHDTAGLRSGGGRVERLGMDRTRAAVARADVVLDLALSTAVSGGAGPDAGTAAAGIARDGGPAPVVLRVWTQSDRLDAAPHERLRDGAGLITSARSGEGLTAVWEAIATAAERERLVEAADLGVVLNLRHRARLARCRDELQQLVRELESAEPPGEEVVAGWLGAALGELGEISGRVYTERLLGEVFGRFCVGK